MEWESLEGLGCAAHGAGVCVFGRSDLCAEDDGATVVAVESVHGAGGEGEVNLGGE